MAFYQPNSFVSEEEYRPISTTEYCKYKHFDGLVVICIPFFTNIERKTIENYRINVKKRNIDTKSDHSNEIDIDDVFNSIFHWHNVSYSLNVKRILIEPSMFVPNARFAHFPISLHRLLVLALTSDESIPKIRKKTVLFAAGAWECIARCIYNVICISLRCDRHSIENWNLCAILFSPMRFYSKASRKERRRTRI